VAVSTNHRDEVAELLADYRRSREELASVQRTLLSISESVTSPDGLVTATVDATGALSGLVIDDDAYRQHRPAELADAVLRATRAAAARAGERARQALAPVLPADADPAAVLSGRADLTPEELEPQPVVVPRAVRPTAEDEESYEDRTWMKQAGRGR
jgi:DNA-binding protein YbaB